jgi:hypothetical protein
MTFIIEYRLIFFSIFPNPGVYLHFIWSGKPAESHINELWIQLEKYLWKESVIVMASFLHATINFEGLQRSLTKQVNCFLFFKGNPNKFYINIRQLSFVLVHRPKKNLFKYFFFIKNGLFMFETFKISWINYVRFTVCR